MLHKGDRRRAGPFPANTIAKTVFCMGFGISSIHIIMPGNALEAGGEGEGGGKNLSAMWITSQTVSHFFTLWITLQAVQPSVAIVIGSSNNDDGSTVAQRLGENSLLTKLSVVAIDDQRYCFPESEHF